MSLTVAITAKPCHYCGSYHSTICPRVEEIEYHQDGSVKRVRLRGPDTPAEPIVVTPDPDLYAYEGDPTGRDPRTKLGTEPGWKGLFRKRADSQPEDEA